MYFFEFKYNINGIQKDHNLNGFKMLYCYKNISIMCMYDEIINKI